MKLLDVISFGVAENQSDNFVERLMKSGEE